MSNPKVFPDFDDRWILHLSDDLVVVDKPPGVPTQAPSPDEPDDLVVRLGRYLDERGLGTYLGVHQRLDPRGDAPRRGHQHGDQGIWGLIDGG